VALYHEEEGSGPPIVFIHAGIADSRMWEPQWASFATRYRLLRCDLPGFGRTPLDDPAFTYARDVIDLLDELAVSSAVLVGASLGGRVALEIAVTRPDLVGALVLVAAGLPGHLGSETVRAYGEAEDAAVARGDLAAATELNLRMWVDGPRRSAADVDPSVRATAGEMVRRALELQAHAWEDLADVPLVDDLADRLGDVQAPTLVIVGDEDVDDIRALAQKLVDEIPRARLATIRNAAHLPSLEQPAVFDDLVLGFLASEAQGLT
jgi:3-oxoadipate enol-lactonase